MAVAIEGVEEVVKPGTTEVSEDDKEKLVGELSSILSYMEKVNESDTTDVEPKAHVIPLKNVFRDDAVKPFLPREKV